MAVVPKNNLPPDSQAFARDLQERLAKLETTVGNLNTLVTGSNSRLGSLVKSVNTLDGAVTTLDATVATLDRATAWLEYPFQTAQQGSASVGSTTPGFVLMPFDPAVDADIFVVQPGPGSEFMVQPAGYLSVNSPSGATRVGLCFEVGTGGHDLIDPFVQLRAPNTAESVSAIATNGGWAGSLAGPFYRVTMTAPGTFTVRTRRFYDAASSGGSVTWSPSITTINYGWNVPFFPT